MLTAADKIRAQIAQEAAGNIIHTVGQVMLVLVRDVAGAAELIGQDLDKEEMSVRKAAEATKMLGPSLKSKGVRVRCSTSL